ncbi:hypothetical protein [Sphingomonas sp.]|jgi:hypothetical protein|uniref:hypothetical protein n=1 Tax=Sphingomonas sp. TaxID=28214 RepID=UPI002EDB6FD0
MGQSPPSRRHVGSFLRPNADRCGFSSTVHGNDIAMEQQSAKMRLVIDVAKDVWGEL